MGEKTKEVKAINYLSLALYAFAGLGIEALYGFLLEPLIYGQQMADWNTRQSIIHWTITCISWVIVAYVILEVSKRRYGFDIFIRTLILVFGQKAFELWFKKKDIPYGGIILALTWGLAHIFTKGSIAVGLLSALGGFIFGIVYLLVNRDIKKTIPILFLMFIL